MSRIAPDVIEAVISLSMNRVPVKVISETCHVSERTVSRIRHDRGVAHLANGITEAEDHLALQMLQDGASYKEVARTLGRSHANLSRRFPGYAWTHQQCGQFTRVANQLRSIA